MTRQYFIAMDSTVRTYNVYGTEAQHNEIRLDMRNAENAPLDQQRDLLYKLELKLARMGTLSDIQDFRIK